MYDEMKIERYYENLDEISYVRDGINNLTQYKEVPLKILWVLKEAHAKDKTKSWDHRCFHSEELLNYRYWKKTYSKIIRISYALLHNISNISGVKFITDFSQDEILNVMRKIAIINVKKNVGDSASKKKVITEHYNKHHKILHEQINEICPDIIINGSGKWEIIGSESVKESQCIGSQKFEGYFNNQRIGIHAHHPMSTYGNYESEVLELVFKCRTEINSQMKKCTTVIY